MPTCGLYFGSFNPLHIGHVAIINYLVSYTCLNEVRVILSPQNPLKAPQEATPEALQARLAHLQQLMDRRGFGVKVSDVEFHLPKPLYTYQTLTHLSSLEPHTQFIPVIGADQLAHFTSWHRWEDLLHEYPWYVYPRQGYDLPSLCRSFAPHCPKGITPLNAPLVTISSTFIRQGLSEGKNMNGFIAQP